MKKMKEKTKDSTAKIAVYYTISNFMVKGILFLTTPIFTRLLTKSEYGLFTVFASLEGILFIITSLDLQSSIARAKYDYGEEMDKYLLSILLCANIVTVLLYIIMEYNQAVFLDIFRLDIQYVRMLFVYLFFSPAFTFMQIKFRIYRNYRFFIIFSVLSAILKASFPILLVLLLENKLSARIIGYLIPVTIFNAGIWLYIFLKGKKPSIKHMGYGLFIALPLLPHALSNNLLSSSDRIMISKICGVEYASFYSISYMVCMMASLLWTSMNQAWSPWLFDCLAADHKAIVFKRSRIYVGIFASIVIFLLLLAPELVLVFGGRQYMEARFLMPPIIVGFMFQFIYGMYVNIEIYRKKTLAISIGTVTAAIINIGLNLVLLPVFGYMAAAYTTLAGYFLLYVFHYRIVKKMHIYSNIYDERFIREIMIIVVAVGILALFLYQNNVIRYTLCAFYLGHFIWKVYKMSVIDRTDGV